MRTYKLTIAYDGSKFRGWQRQPDTELTIQGILEKNISELAGYPVEVHGSGRTDGGVHARGQTASFTLSGKIEEESFRTAVKSEASGRYQGSFYGACEESFSCKIQRQREVL